MQMTLQTVFRGIFRDLLVGALLVLPYLFIPNHF